VSPRQTEQQYSLQTATIAQGTVSLPYNPAITVYDRIYKQWLKLILKRWKGMGALRSLSNG